MSKSQARFWMAELPQGDPFGGPAYGKREDPISIVTAVATSMAGAAVSGLMSKGSSKGSTPAAPAVEKPTLMPDPILQQEALKRKASIMQSQQMGRASTVLTGGDNKLGG